MRSLFRRKGNKEAESSEPDTSRPYSGLGIFSPLIKTDDSDSAHECRRLAELESIFIKSKRLESLDDVPFIVNQVRDGNIILLDISNLNVGKEQAQMELKRIIERIRGQTRSLNADIALVNDECVIVTPSFVRF